MHQEAFRFINSGGTAVNPNFTSTNLQAFSETDLQHQVLFVTLHTENKTDVYEHHKSMFSFRVFNRLNTTMQLFLQCTSCNPKVVFKGV